MRVFIIVVVLCLFSHAAFAAAPANAMGAIVILVVDFSDGPSDVGTGFFIDHDGLIATADHVIRGLSIVGGDNSSPTQTKHPTRVTVYSAQLAKNFVINLSTNDQITTGDLGNGRWVDMALLRVPLDTQGRSQVTPLDLLVDPIPAGATLYVYGPACTDAGDTNCFQPNVLPANVTNPVERARVYVTNAIATPGYSGGPLVDEFGRAVGVGSTLASIGLSNFGGRASYVPIPYLARYIAAKIPKSSFFSDPHVCDKIESFPNLTLIDIDELSPKWSGGANLDAGQCRCCCDALDKAPAALLTSPFSNASCAPPFCAERRLYGTLRNISMTIHDPEATLGEITTAVQSANSILSGLSKPRADLTSSQQAGLLRTLGGVLREVRPTLGSVSALPETLKTTDILALTALIESENFHESAAGYDAIKAILHRERLVDLELTAGILADYSHNREIDPSAAKNALKQHHLDPAKLQHDLETGISSSTNKF